MRLDVAASHQKLGSWRLISVKQQLLQQGSLQDHSQDLKETFIQRQSHHRQKEAQAQPCVLSPAEALVLQLWWWRPAWQWHGSSTLLMAALGPGTATVVLARHYQPDLHINCRTMFSTFISSSFFFFSFLPRAQKYFNPWTVSFKIQEKK